MTEVYKSIATIQGELAKTGIAKSNQGHGYKFRGIDDVYAAVAPLLSKHGLCIIPRMIERVQVDRKTNSGGNLFYVTVKAEFDFVATKDGSTHTACTYGEAMDSSDKATNKAMSAAYKYAAFMTFAIPTEGDNDADAQTHDVALVVPETVELFVSDLRAASDKAAFWTDNFKNIPPAWRAYVTTQKEKMKESA